MFNFRRRRIYLDYASAPGVLPEAVRAMREAEYLIGNPGAIHAEGVAAKKRLEDSRARIAAQIGCKAREIIFTSGLTEANSLAIIGFARKLEFLRSDLKGAQGRTLENTHWIVSSIEHDSVLGAFSEIERLGASISHVEPDERGIVLPKALERVLRPETVFVSIGWANNEIGVIQPLRKIARALREHEEKHGVHIVFHTDAGQAPLYLPTTVESLGVDSLALGGNKLYGPHGIGALYVGNRVVLAPVLLGGKQERGLRAGTESVALAAGFAAAFETITKERVREAKRLSELRDELAKELVSKIAGLVVNGDLEHTLPHMLNVSIPDISSEYLTLALDHAGIALSTKSACREGEESRSHVVEALGPAGSAEPAGWRAENTMRFSLGRDTTIRDIEYVVRTLPAVLGRTY